MLATVVNTHSKCKDLWPMFFGQLMKHYPSANGYVFVDDLTDLELPETFTAIQYGTDLSFTEQFFNSLEKVEEDLVLYMNEDYILYDDVSEEFLKFACDMLGRTELDFFRLQKGDSYGTTGSEYAGVYHVRSESPDLFSQTPGIWKTQTLLDIHEHGKNLGIGGNDPAKQFEPNAAETCRDLGVTGVYCYHGELKRGSVHYDSAVFPAILSALVKGKWNYSEYEDELAPILRDYGVYPSGRGVR